MTKTAVKTSQATGGEMPRYEGMYLAPDGGKRLPQTVKLPPGLQIVKPSEPSPEPHDKNRLYLKNLRTLKERIVMRAVRRGTTFEFITLADSAPERPAVADSVQTKPSPARDLKQHYALKAFLMHIEHLKYLERVSTSDDPLISRDTALLAARAWTLIWDASDGKMPIPAACTGPDGQMLYAWDHGRHHLELEIIPQQPAEFFYKDRETRELWSEDYTIGDPIPAEAVERFGFFL